MSRPRNGISGRLRTGSSDLGTVGTPIDEVEIRILNEGEVAVRSPMVMSGYVADPEWNLRGFEDGFFRTGDLGCLDSDGRLRLLGRTRRMINMAGVKVDPAEIEQAVESLEGVVECHVDAGGGDRETELIRARIELREGFDMSDRRRSSRRKSSRRWSRSKASSSVMSMRAAAIARPN